MPIFLYEDQKSGKRVQVLRGFSEFADLPTREEAKEMSDEEFAIAQWLKVFHGVSVTHIWPRHNWPGKGNWGK